MGHTIQEMPNARLSAEDNFTYPQKRADDINQAFADPDIDMIIASIGGEDGRRVLPYIDADIVRANPKP
jgi:muramoyltetrapeptide carboxypeptidase LdcA involved in peptidoglycan recycling